MTALAVTAGHAVGGVVLVGAAVLTGQLSIGWLNDLLDAPRDRAVGRRDKPVVSGEVTVAALRVATALAVVACVHLVAVAAGWIYDLGGKSTWWSVVPYVVCFGLLPAFVVLALPGAPLPPWWLPVAGALLGAGAHFANVLPDLDDDAATGVRGLPHRIGAPASRAAAAALLLAATTVVAVSARLPVAVAVAVPAVAAVVLAVGFAARGRAPFRAVLAVAVLAVAMLLASGPALVA
jgi:4-hydroxybenzoate polyprenyltransferase